MQKISAQNFDAIIFLLMNRKETTPKIEVLAKNEKKSVERKIEELKQEDLTKKKITNEGSQ